jgi:hypothetical protein
VWTEWGATNDPIEKELREWLGIVPWEWQLRQNTAHFVRKLYMLTWMEVFVEEHPSTRGARLYSLLPVATSFQAAYVKINASTLYGMFARLRSVDRSREWVDENLWAELNIDLTKKRASDLPRPFTKKTFQTHRSEIMRKVLSVAQFETEKCKFADEVKTNGNAVSVTMICPLTTTSVITVEKMVPKKRKKNDGASSAETPTKPQVKSPTELAERDSLAKELFARRPHRDRPWHALAGDGGHSRSTPASTSAAWWGSSQTRHTPSPTQAKDNGDLNSRVPSHGADERLPVLG